MPDMPTYVRATHVPRHRDVGMTTVFRWARTGKLAVHRTGAGRTFVALEDVDALLGPAA